MTAWEVFSRVARREWVERLENPVVCASAWKSSLFAVVLALFTKVSLALEWKPSWPGDGGLWANLLGCGMSLTPCEGKSRQDVSILAGERVTAVPSERG